MKLTDISDEEIDEHLSVFRYGNFILSNAVRPAYNLSNVPTEGFTLHSYRLADTNEVLPALIASVSREKIVTAFHGLLNDTIDPTGEVHAMLDGTHYVESREDEPEQFIRHPIDRVVLQSYLKQERFENLLLNDGCSGISVVNVSDGSPLEVQLDEHKLFYLAGDMERMESCIRVFQSLGICYRHRMQSIIHSEHLHQSNASHREAFEDLVLELDAEKIQN